MKELVLIIFILIVGSGCSVQTKGLTKTLNQTKGLVTYRNSSSKNDLILRKEKSIFDKSIDDYVKVEMDSSDMMFIFDLDNVRVFKNNSTPHENKFHLYKRDELTSYIHRYKRGEVKIDTLIYNWKVNPDWKVDYEIIENVKDAKIISGIMCNFYKIIEKRVTKKSSTESLYEIYTNPKINFPAEIVCGFYENILNECPIEVKVTTLNFPKSTCYITIDKIAKKFDKKLLHLYDIFK